MKLRFAALADAILAQPDGKLNVIGLGVDLIRAASYPYFHPQLSVLFMITFEEDEVGIEQRLQMQIETPTGAALPSADFAITPRRSDDPNLPVRGNIVAGLMGFPFETTGTYVWRLIALDHRVTIGEVSVKAIVPGQSGD